MIVEMARALGCESFLDVLVDDTVVLGKVRVPDDIGPDVMVCGRDGGRWIAWPVDQYERFVLGYSLSHVLLEIGLEGFINEVVH